MAHATAKKRARRVRITGISVLVLGLLAAGVVYAVGLRQAEMNNDPSMLGFNRAEQRQMGQLYGKSGLMVDDLIDDLKEPGVQAILIAVISGAVFSGCWYFARLVEVDDGPPGRQGPSA